LSRAGPSRSRRATNEANGPGPGECIATGEEGKQVRNCWCWMVCGVNRGRDYFEGFQSLANFCASAIWEMVIIEAARSRFSPASSRISLSAAENDPEAARLNHR